MDFAINAGYMTGNQRFFWAERAWIDHNLRVEKGGIQSRLDFVLRLILIIGLTGIPFTRI